jgi:hypothetical protein
MIDQTEESLCDLNFKITREFHTSFKVRAAELRISMKELLERLFYRSIYQTPPSPTLGDSHGSAKTDWSRGVARSR